MNIRTINKTSEHLELTENSAWVTEYITMTEAALDQILPTVDTPPTQLHNAMRYAVLGGGKRIRPLLCFAAGKLTAAEHSVLVPVAAAIEMIHVFSLVQDDLPMMDNDPLRRGKPATHIMHGEATALLVCDALFPLAIQTLSQVSLPQARRLALIQEVTSASGSLGLAGGQSIDLDCMGMQLDRAALEHMNRLKTGELICASLRMGALCGAANDNEHAQLFLALEQYANAIGLAFQIVDDILDFTGQMTVLGKTPGKDADTGKTTWMKLLGLNEATRLAHQLCERAEQVLAPYGSSAQQLRYLSHKIISRIC